MLINVLDPTDQQHTDSTRLIALGILNSAFEEAGSCISLFPSLKALIVDPGCKFLFQLARSENASVLHSALRTISTIFDTIQKHLKLQQELFLAFTIDRLASPISNLNIKGQLNLGTPSGRKNASMASPLSVATKNLEEAANDSDTASSASRVLFPPARGETRDLILETLSQMSGHPSFMVDLYTNYDCDINCENLFERLVDFLTKV